MSQLNHLYKAYFIHYLILITSIFSKTSTSFMVLYGNGLFTFSFEEVSVVISIIRLEFIFFSDSLIFLLSYVKSQYFFTDLNMLHISFSFFEDILLRYPSASENCLGSLLSLDNPIAIYSLTCFRSF